jgi:hypothetical protein
MSDRPQMEAILHDLFPMLSCPAVHRCSQTDKLRLHEGLKQPLKHAQTDLQETGSGPFASCSIPESVRLRGSFGGHHGRREINR